MRFLTRQQIYTDFSRTSLKSFYGSNLQNKVEVSPFRFYEKEFDKKTLVYVKYDMKQDRQSCDLKKNLLR